MEDLHSLAFPDDDSGPAVLDSSLLRGGQNSVMVENLSALRFGRKAAGQGPGINPGLG